MQNAKQPRTTRQYAFRIQIMPLSSAGKYQGPTASYEERVIADRPGDAVAGIEGAVDTLKRPQGLWNVTFADGTKAWARITAR